MMNTNTDNTRYKSHLSGRLGYILSSLIIVLFALLALTCTTEVTLEIQADDSAVITFEAGAGKAFTKMICSAAGVSGNSAAGLIDKDAVGAPLGEVRLADDVLAQNREYQVDNILKITLYEFDFLIV